MRSLRDLSRSRSDSCSVLCLTFNTVAKIIFNLLYFGFFAYLPKLRSPKIPQGCCGVVLVPTSFEGAE
jgi:hypothetical protein